MIFELELTSEDPDPPDFKLFRDFLQTLENTIHSVSFNEYPAPTATSQVNVILTDDETMRELNNNYRKIDATTDVLTFSYIEESTGQFAREPDGEIFISTDTAHRQAEAYGNLYENELALLAAHGIIHVYGIDHENSAEEENLTRELEDHILRAGGITAVSGLTMRAVK